jgi:hypothetical protein
MANEQNLTPWKPGQSGNITGKPKGTKHLSTWIRDMLNDESFVTLIRDQKVGYRNYEGAPLKAIIEALIIKSVNGDLKAFELLCRYGYGTKLDITTQGDKIVLPILSGLSKSKRT